jgi:hypothetical protein
VPLGVGGLVLTQHPTPVTWYGKGWLTWHLQWVIRPTRNVATNFICTANLQYTIFYNIILSLGRWQIAKIDSLRYNKRSWWIPPLAQNKNLLYYFSLTYWYKHKFAAPIQWAYSILQSVQHCMYDQDVFLHQRGQERASPEVHAGYGLIQHDAVLGCAPGCLKYCF